MLHIKSPLVWTGFLVALALLPKLALASVPTLMATLSGKVVSPDGKPLAGARVWIPTFGDKTLAEARTNDQGRFRLGPMEPLYRHPFDLLIDADGFARYSIRGESLTTLASRDRDLGAIRVDRGRVFGGQVLDIDGKPRPNASVLCNVFRFYKGNSVNAIGPAFPLTTDADGRFRTPPLTVGHLNLSVRVPDRQTAVLTRPIAPGGEETLTPVRLENDVPIAGVVQDKDGRAVAGASIQTGPDSQGESDANGRFILRGFGAVASLLLFISKKDHVFVRLQVQVTDRGVRSIDRDMKVSEPAKMLSVQMDPVAWIEGRAIDAETGDPVRIDAAILCFFDRAADGKPVLRGCRSDAFEPLEDGRFRVSYLFPDEYHLTFQAEGYHDAEAITPKVDVLKPIGGLVVKLRKKREGTVPDVPVQTISGKVTRDGKPVRDGWVGLWTDRKRPNSVNVAILRGRTVVDDPIVASKAPIRDGAYVLDVPFQADDWSVAVKEPGQPTTRVGPFSIARNERKRLDIDCIEGAIIKGHVKDVPEAWQGNLWVVAFSQASIRAEARVEDDGRFALPPLPPGDYGLKVGHDASKDSEVARDMGRIIPSLFNAPADPWKRAKRVKIEPGRDLVVELVPPQE